MCETLMPDVVAPKAQSQLHVHVSSADLLLDSIHKNLAWWVVTQRTLKNHKTVKIGGWALARDNMVSVEAASALWAESEQEACFYGGMYPK